MSKYKNVPIFRTKSEARTYVGSNAKNIAAECGCGETQGYSGDKGIAAVCNFCTHE